MRSARAFVCLLLLASAATALSGQQPAPDSEKATFERLCGTCHEAERSTSSRRTRDQWLQTVNQMVARGAEGTDAELMEVVDYLTREHGRVNMNLGNAADIALVLDLTPEEGDAVVRFRRDNGAFEDAAAVRRVPGVDVKKLDARIGAMVFGSRVASNIGRVPVAALTAANNWPGVNGGPQRDGWARPEAMLGRSTVGAVRLLYSRTLDDQGGANALTPPLVLGNLISYRGFKEMLFIGARADTIYSIDAVLNRVLWTTRLPVTSGSPHPPTDPACAAGLMGIVMTGSAAGGLGAATTVIRRPGAPPPGVLPGAATARSGLIVGLSNGFGRNGLLLTVGSDGNVHPLYQSSGRPYGSPIPFLPAGATARHLNLFDNTLYATTSAGCRGPHTVYAVDLASDDKTIATFKTGEAANGSFGPAIGHDGTVYVHAGSKLVALTAKELKEQAYFETGPQGVTPLVFRRNGKDVVVAAGPDRRLVLLDGASLGGLDHRTTLAETPPLGVMTKALASWEDPETGSRWIYVPLESTTSGSGGAIAAVRIDDRNGLPVLSPQWTFRGIAAPAAPAIANGLVFALSTGSSSTGAVLHVIDAVTGKQLFSSGATVRGRANADAGLAIANGRVYFTTSDNTVYSFGIPTEH